MSAARPVARDGHGSPISVARQAPDDHGATRHGPVTHAHAAMVFCTAGRARVEMRGAWELRAGELLLVPAGEPHRLIERVGLRSWAIGFCVSCLAADGGAAVLEPFERVRDGGSAVVAVPRARHAYLETLLGELEALGADARSEGASIDPVRRSLITLVLAEAARAAREHDPRRRAAPGLVAEALRHIERHCLGPLTLEDVAAAVGRSPAHVTTALRRATGRTAGAWIVSGRMAEARRLLLHSAEPVDVIAGRVGYADATHFIRLFRRMHGATPSAWRAMQLTR